MSSAEAHDTSDGKVDMHLEIDIIPVSNVERTKQFYECVGWRFDADDAPLDGLRIVQFTPPGSGCSVTFGEGLTAAAPGSAEAGLTVSDIEAAHAELVDRGIDASEVWHGPPFPPEARVAGPDPEHASYGSFCSFSDPDGNTWLVHEVTTRLPAGSTALRRRSHRRRTWWERFSAPKPLTASTRGALDSQTRTGPPGTPRTWWPSSTGWSCRPERFHARRAGRACGGRGNPARAETPTPHSAREPPTDATGSGKTRSMSRIVGRGSSSAGTSGR